MKTRYPTLRCVLLLFVISAGAAVSGRAGTGYEYSRGELMGNSGLTIFRAADFGNHVGLCIYLDGVPITTLSRGEGYRAMIRPGRHVLKVMDTPSPYGKTKFTLLPITLASGQNYALTAIWDVETITLEDGNYQFHGFYR